MILYPKNFVFFRVATPHRQDAVIEGFKWLLLSHRGMKRG